MGEYLLSFQSLILVVHYSAIVILVISILLQSGKGVTVGAMFGGGGSQSLFGARGAGNFLTKVTTVAAVVLLSTSLSLSTVANYKAKGGFNDSVLENEDVVESATDSVAPVTPEAPAAEGSTDNQNP